MPQNGGIAVPQREPPMGRLSGVTQLRLRSACAHLRRQGQPRRQVRRRCRPIKRSSWSSWGPQSQSPDCLHAPTHRHATGATTREIHAPAQLPTRPRTGRTRGVVPQRRTCSRVRRMWRLPKLARPLREQRLRRPRSEKCRLASSMPPCFHHVPTLLVIPVRFRAGLVLGK